MFSEVEGQLVFYDIGVASLKHEDVVEVSMNK